MSNKSTASHWTPYSTETGDVYYVNSETNESLWQDEYISSYSEAQGDAIHMCQDFITDIPPVLIRKQGAIAWKDDSWHYHWGNSSFLNEL